MKTVAAKEANRTYHRNWRAKNKERLRKKHRDYYAANHETLRANMQRYSAQPSNRMRILAGPALGRAARRGLEYDADLASVLAASPPTHCACCGKYLDYRMGKGRGKGYTSPSLDRFNNAEGYTAANVRIICGRCNHIKGDATVEELESVLRYMRRG